MKTTPRTYVLTMDSPSRKGFRLWMGDSIHALRHCSVKQIGLALRELQQNVDSLQTPVSSSSGTYSLNRATDSMMSSSVSGADMNRNVSANVSRYDQPLCCLNGWHGRSKKGG
jgi:hypothetical protein